MSTSAIAIDHTNGVHQWNLHNSRRTTRTRTENLWDKAVEALSESDKQQIDFSRFGKLAVLNDLLDVVEEKKRRCTEQSWKYQKKDGEVVTLRDSLEKVVRWVNKFKEVGDVAVQYDPSHAALPWAGVCLVLQMLVNDSQTYGAMIEGLELVSRLVARYALVEGLYLQGTSAERDQLADSITRLYTAILVYLSKARRYYDRRAGGRIARSIVQTADMGVETYLRKISEEVEKVDGLARLIDAEFLRKTAAFMHSGFTGLNDRLDGLTCRFEELQLSLNAQFSKSVVGRERLLEWLNGVFTDEEYEAALASRLDGTCDWILQRSQFRAWVTADGVSDTRRILWVHGPPGFGKTVLCARLVQFLQNQSVPVAFFFCVSEAKRQPVDIARSWVAQMVNKNQDALEAASEVYCGKEARAATTSDVWQLLRTICLRTPNCVFIVDGFDECTRVDKALPTYATVAATDFLQQLVESIKQTGTRILFVSRDDADIRSQFTEPASSSELFYEYEIKRPDARNDIDSFSKSVIDKNLANKRSAFREELAEEAAQRCEGMFLWIRLLRSRLSPGKNAKQLREVVAETPAGLEQTYQRDLERITKLSVDERERAIAILRWTLFAQRPLTVREMTEALMVDVDDGSGTYPSDDLPDAWDEPYVNDQIRRLCGSLIELRGQEQDSVETQTIHFVHFSVREYLSSAINVSFPGLGMTFLSDAAAENELLARVCLRYLCYDDLTEEHHGTQESLQEKIEQYPFLAYAARFWHVHASHNGAWSPNLGHLINRLFDPLASRWILWSDIFESAEESSGKLDESFSDNFPSPIYYASLLGFVKTLEYLRIQGLDLDRRGGTYGSALQAAAVNNHKHAVEFLLSHGADVNIRGGKFGSAIAGAASNGSAEDTEAVVQLLIAAGADVSSTDDEGRTALYFAARSGLVSVVELLLRQKADARSISTGGKTALHTASGNGHKAVIKLLLDRGAEIEAANNEGVTPLHLAAKHAHAEAITFLVEQGADVTARSNEGWTPLFVATMTGNAEIVKFLVEQGADVTARCNEGWTPLLVATETGNAEIVEFLVEQGADMKACTDEGWTPLHVAAAGGNAEVVAFVLEQGADMKACTNNGWTPLLVAAANGNAEVVTFLLEQGADMKTCVDGGLTLLHIAAYSGTTELVMFLVRQGADVEALTKKGQTPLYSAVESGNTEVVKFLVEQSADIKTNDENGWTPLHVAAENGNTEVAKFLIEQSADVKITNKDGWTPLHLAAETGNTEAVIFLVEQGADVGARTNKGWTPLHGAVENGNTEVVKFLVEQSADVKTNDENGWTPLHAAAEKGNIEVVKFLVEQGAVVKACDIYGWTPLHAAAEKGNTEIVKFLVKQSADVTASDKGGWTPLHAAAETGNTEVVTFLVKQGADIEASTGKGWTTPLHKAVEKGNTEAVKLLVKQGADTSARTSKKWTPLHTAVEKGNTEIVKFLVEQSADVTASDKGGWTPLHVVAETGDTEVVMSLVRQGANVEACTNTGWTPLHAAAEKGNIEVVKLLVKQGADTSARTSRRWTLLHAAAKGNTEVVTFLVEQGADVKASDEDGWTPLHVAAQMGSTEVVMFLVGQGADVDACTNDEWTPLHAAAGEGKIEVVKLLVKQGADTSARNSRGWTPLHAAAETGNTEVIKVLVEQGADVKAIDKVGWTPLRAAAGSGHVNVVKVLLAKGTNLTISDNDGGRTPLSAAASKGHVDVVKVLLGAGASVNDVDDFRRTSLHLALYCGNEATISELIKHGADPTLIDDYGRSCLDWAFLHRPFTMAMSSWSQRYTETPGKVKLQRLRHSVRSLCERLTRLSESDPNPGFYELGYCLMFLQDFEEACTSFRQQAIVRPKDQLVTHKARCNSCGTDRNIDGLRFVCKTCPELDLCATCMASYGKQDMMPSCHGHSFLEVVVPDGDDGAFGPVPDLGKSKVEWLQRLSQKYEEP